MPRYGHETPARGNPGYLGTSSRVASGHQRPSGDRQGGFFALGRLSLSKTASLSQVQVSAMPPRHPRSLKILLPPETRVGLMVAAQVRGIEVEQLAMILLTVIIGDDLVTAILDGAALLAQPGEDGGQNLSSR
jgi:hypothetical protein